MKILAFLGLKNAAFYTSHAFRTAAIIFLSNSDIYNFNFKRRQRIFIKGDRQQHKFSKTENFKQVITCDFQIAQ